MSSNLCANRSFSCYIWITDTGRVKSLPGLGWYYNYIFNADQAVCPNYW